MRINRSLHKGDHSIQLRVTRHRQGWEVRQQEDSETVSDVVYSDWHRVERAVAAFDRKEAALRRQGWTESPGSAPHSRSAA